MRELVEKELASLDIGVQIAKLRAKHRLNQINWRSRPHECSRCPELRARRPSQLDTLIRLAQALGARLEVRLVEEKEKGAGPAGREQAPSAVDPDYLPPARDQRMKTGRDEMRNPEYCERNCCPAGDTALDIAVHHFVSHASPRTAESAFFWVGIVTAGIVGIFSLIGGGLLLKRAR